MAPAGLGGPGGQAEAEVGILRAIWAGWAHFWPFWEAFWLLGTCFQWIWELKTRVLSTLTQKMASKPAF